MQWRAIKLGMTVLAFTPMLTGCWDAKDIQDIISVMGMGIDLTDQGDVQVTVETPASAGEGQGQQSQSQEPAQLRTRIISTTGPTMEDAFDDLAWRVPRQLMFSHSQIMVLGEQYAKRSVRDALDFITRHQQLRTADVMFIITDGHAKDMLKAMTTGEYLNAHYLRELTSSKGATFHTGVDLLNDFLAPSQTAALPWVTIAEDGFPKLKGVGILQNFRLRSYWQETTTRTLEWFTGPSQGEYITLNGKKGSASIYIISGNSKVQVKSRKPLRFQIRASGSAQIANMEDDEVPTAKVMARLNRELDASIENDLRREVRHMREKQLDAANFGTTLWRADPTLWKQYKKNWPKQLSEIPVDYEVHFHLLRSGFTQRDSTRYPEDDQPKER